MIRPARLTDLEALVAGNCAMATETEHVQLDERTVRDGVAALLGERAPGAYWVADEAGTVIGQLMVTYEWSDWRNRVVWWVQSVYVRPEHRGKGVYRRLYATVREAARAAGAAGLRLYVDNRNERAHAVYTALGMDGAHYRVFEDMFSEPPRDE